ncbi:cysteine proteinase [Nadsonia fulvescens var. elongata DSM 6958]|uniref:ubiquitinyl hydrolase 1 n=1 Tax=Nadsonia fulvescens var. elongata DSM 6958 TaxID=857566 RepID=A0A1E3PMP0_9ASCO|nr:cysteine proteinase [Nadsonia fulvescens var. elongata DSM 6958]
MKIFGNLKLNGGMNLLYDILRCRGYFITQRDMRFVSSSEYSFYETLGAVEDMSDNLILECYNAQVFSDSKHSHHYMDALREISQSRQSDHLTMNVMQFLSLGAATTNDVKEAYACFDLVEDDEATDQFIVDMYLDAIKARPSKEAFFQNALKVITGTRKSDFLQSVLDREMMDISTSYGVLRCSENATDEEIIKSYESLILSHDFTKVQMAVINKAILNVGKVRTSALILTFISDMNQVEINVDDAYEFFGLSRSDDDESIITIASIRINDTPDQIIEIRRALKAIANDKNSTAIENYLQAGSVNTKAQGGNKELEPRGLHNIGNTCYLNSLLQYYFSIKPLREAILEFESSDQKESLSNEAIQKKRLGSLPVTISNVQKGQEFIRQLSILFQELISSKDSVVIPTKELAYLALSTRDQGFEFLENLSANQNTGNVSEDIKKEVKSQASLIEVPVNMTVDVMEVAVTPTRSPADTLVNELSDHELESSEATKSPSVSQKRESEINLVLFGRQQDVTECIENVLFQIEAAYKPERFDESGEQIDFIKRLFYGTTVQTIQPLVPDTVTRDVNSKRREKTEWFSNLLVNVADGPRDIYDALDSYFQDEILELSEGKIKRSLAVSNLPSLLQIQVQRVQYDAVLQEAFKSEALLQYDEIIYLDRYMAENMKDTKMQQKRSEVQSWRAEITKLKARKKSLLEIKHNNMSFKDSLIVTRNWLNNNKDSLLKDENVSVSERTISVIDAEITKITKELTYINETIEDLETKINTQFADPSCQKLGYKIQAVFIHSGKVDFGHYWTYIKDFKTDTWRKYNDEKIDIVDRQEVFDVDMNRKPVPTPYYLVFVKEDLVDEFIAPLCRVVEPDEMVVDTDVDGEIDVKGEMDVDGETDASLNTEQGPLSEVIDDISIGDDNNNETTILHPEKLDEISKS